MITRRNENEKDKDIQAGEYNMYFKLAY